MGSEAPSGRSPWGRFLSLFLLFILFPVSLGGLLVFYAGHIEEEYRLSRETERLEIQLSRLACRYDPEAFIRKKFKWLRDAIFRRSVSPASLEAISLEIRRRFGFSCEIYVMDGHGKLLNPPDCHFRSMKAMERLWGAAITHDPKAVEEYRNGGLKILQSFLGDEFLGSRMRKSRDFPIRIRGNGKDGVMFWDRDPYSRGGGLIMLVREIPTRLGLLKTAFSRSRIGKGISFLVQDRGGSIHSLSGKGDERERNLLVHLFKEARKTSLDWGGKRWVAAKLGEETYFAGRGMDLSRMESRMRAVFIFLILIGVVWTVILFRFLIQGHDPYLPIRVKLTGLFLFTLLLPMMGVTFLAHRLLRDREGVLRSGSFQSGNQILGNIDSGFVDEKQRLEKIFKGLRDDPDLVGNLPRFRARVRKHLSKLELRVMFLVDMGGTPVVVEGDALEEKSRYAMESFFRVSIEKKLPDRLLLFQKLGGKGKLADVLLEEFLRDPASGFPYIMEHPGTTQMSRIGNREGIWFWDVFPDPSHPYAMFFVDSDLGFAIENFLERRLNRRESFEQGAFRLVAFSHTRERWFPEELSSNPSLGDLANRVRIHNDVLRDSVRIGKENFLVVGIPGKHLQGYSLFALFPEKVILENLANLKKSIGIGFFLALAMAVLLGLTFSETFLAPVAELTLGVEAMHNHETRFRLKTFPKDELGGLAKAFNDMLANLDELQTARIIQKELHPSEVLELGEYRVFGISRAATDLGGDYFDYQAVGGRNILLLCGDVSGHGVPAALIMTMSKALVQRFSLGKGSVLELLDDLNQVFFKAVKKKRTMTLGAVWIDTETHEGTYFNCGHTYPHLLSGGKLDETVAAQGSLLGIHSRLKVVPRPISLKPGQRLVFYTDGLIESISEDGEDGYLKFIDHIQSRPWTSLREFCRDILDSHPCIRKGGSLPDDFTIVILERKVVEPGVS